MTLNPIAVAIPFFFALIGVELAVARWQGRSVYRFADALTDLSCGISQQATGVLFKAVTIGVYVWVYQTMRVSTLASDHWATHVFAFFAVDFAYYVWHRFTHEVRIGWATHVVHHQSEDYNLAVALRQSITSGLSSWPFALPFAVLGVPPAVWFTHSALNTLYQFWIHTETLRRLGPLEWVLNTPAHHRVHHAINANYLDKNYAGVLIIWDRLLGTFTEEVEEPVYGTVKPFKSMNALWANVSPFVGLAREAVAAPSAGGALRVLFGRPSDEAVSRPPPATRAAQVKYDPSPSAGVRVYLLVQFLPMAALVTWLISVADSASPLTKGIAVTLLLWTVATFAGLIEGRRWAVPLEVGRGVAVAAVLVGLSWGW